MATKSPAGLRQLIWNLTLLGFVKGIKETGKLKETYPLAAAIKRASLYYSYRLAVPLFFPYPFMMWAAEQLVWVALDLVNRGRGRLSHGDCDVVGTILLRRRCLEGARKYLSLGLALNPPPHSEALLRIGMAEVAYEQARRASSYERLRHDAEVHEYISTALRLRPAVEQEEDRVQALRQFCRVLLRAAVLERRRSQLGTAADLYKKAQAIANDPVTGSRGQRLKNWIGWNL